MRTTPISLLVGGLCAIVLGLAFKSHVVPFLESNTIQSGGVVLPTTDLLSIGSRWFFILGSACVMGALVWLAFRRRKMKP